LCCFARLGQAEVSTLHLAHSHARTQLDGEFTHGEIRDPGHRRKEHVIAGLQAADMHWEKDSTLSRECKGASGEPKDLLDIF
jgi:hypothetical protein